MQKQSLISVIIPIFNVAEYLPRCIKSVLEQTYSNLEIILVDDGSTDAGSVICDQYAALDSRIRVIHKENGGLSDARNAGLDICRGEYITFVDSDDIIHKQYIERLFGNIGDCDMIYCNYADFEHDGQIYSLAKEGNAVVKTFSQDEFYRQLLNPAETLPVVSWNKLYRKELWNALRFQKGMIHEDEFAIHHLASQCRKIGYLDEVLYFYRVRPNSITSDKKSERSLLHKIAAYYDRYVFFKGQNLNPYARVMLGHILYRCAMQTVRQDDPTWGKVNSFSCIFQAKGISLKIKLVLLLKKIAYPLYQKLYPVKRT